MTETLTQETEERVEYQPPYQVYAVADWHPFVERFEKLEKRAAKLGIAPPTYTVLATDEHVLRTVKRDGQVSFYIGNPVLDPGNWTPSTNPVTGEQATNETLLTVRLLTIEGATPKYEGWTFLATLQHAGEAGNILRVIPGYEEPLPEEFRHTTPDRCDQCHQKRDRVTTYIVKNDDGRYAQVGSTCIADFLGGANPEAIARWAEYLAGFDIGYWDGEDDEYRGGYEEDRWSLLHFLSTVAAYIEADGWVSRGKARTEGGTATADDAVVLLRNRGPIKDKRGNTISPDITEEHQEQARRAIEWTRDLPEAEYGDNDFLWNLHVVFGGETVETKTAGIAAAVFVAIKYREAKDEKEQVEETGRPGEYLGEVKEKLELTVTPIFFLPIEGDYGTKVLTKFRTEDGDLVTWFNSGATDESRPDLDPTGNAYQPVFQENGLYRIRATVKAHEEYRGDKQTVVLRVKKLETLAEPAENLPLQAFYSRKQAAHRAKFWAAKRAGRLKVLNLKNQAIREAERAAREANA